ncbi:MAG: hypothetical protein RBT49_16885 [Bacteroidales bacterium]|jgi:hypothetical protein|nr:hypothetical protein [Bacteroidales bacterium]
MRFFVAIDDTDNLESRGTGFRAREMGKLIVEQGIGDVESISRHQLYVHENIPFTSHNSSACLIVNSDKYDALQKLCSEYLIRESAEGSDAGLCIAREESINEQIIDWGNRAKKEILTKENAHKLANERGIFLEGYTGTKIGVIGSLAAVGLRKAGNDGRSIWVKGKELREISGVFSGSELKKISHIQVIKSVDDTLINDNERIDVGNWLRPVIQNKKITVIVEKTKNNENHEWQHVSKEYIKNISN